MRLQSPHLHGVQSQVVGVEAQEHLATCAPTQELDYKILVHKHAAPELLYA